MSELRIGLVAEGPTDYVIVEASLRSRLKGKFKVKKKTETTSELRARQYIVSFQTLAGAKSSSAPLAARARARARALTK